jgi:hypothetical protein
VTGGRLVREELVTSRGEHKQRTFMLSYSKYTKLAVCTFYTFFSMSSTELSSDASSFMSDNEYLSEYEEISDDEGSQIETSINDATTSVENFRVLTGDSAAFAWSDDPIADEEWTAEYEEDIRQDELLEEKMQEHLNGTTEISEWYYCVYCCTYIKLSVLV